jgi:hypothetical protein
VKGPVIPKQEEWVDNVKWRRRVFEFPEDGSAINVVQENVELMRLIKKSPVLNKDVLYLSAALILLGHTDGCAGQFLQCV